MLLQVLEDEFECELDDGSEVVVAREIVRLRAACLRGETGEVEGMYKRWMENKGRREEEEERLRRLQVVEHRHGEGDEEDDEEDSEDEEDEDEDVEMGEEDDVAASVTQPRRQRQEPEVDEEGFTMVKKRGR